MPSSEVKTSRIKIKFSFEYYDSEDDTYCLSNFSQEQVKHTLRRLKDISSKNFNELMQQKRVLHFGEVYWEKTIQLEGFKNRLLDGLPPFHFALLGVNEQLARVYGAYSEGVFFIVWFDLEHKIWPTPLKNT